MHSFYSPSSASPHPSIVSSARLQSQHVYYYPFRKSRNPIVSLWNQDGVGLIIRIIQKYSHSNVQVDFPHRKTWDDTSFKIQSLKYFHDKLPRDIRCKMSIRLRGRRLVVQGTGKHNQRPAEDILQIKICLLLFSERFASKAVLTRLIQIVYSMDLILQKVPVPGGGVVSLLSK